VRDFLLDVLVGACLFLAFGLVVWFLIRFPLVCLSALTLAPMWCLGSVARGFWLDRDLRL
jgi:hypothetical protein